MASGVTPERGYSIMASPIDRLGGQGMTAEETWEPARFPCPNCGEMVVVSQVQGDRCRGCDYEITRYGPREAHSAEDFYVRVSGSKFRVELGGELGTAIVHE